MQLKMSRNNFTLENKLKMLNYSPEYVTSKLRTERIQGSFSKTSIQPFPAKVILVNQKST